MCQLVNLFYIYTNILHVKTFAGIESSWKWEDIFFVADFTL